MLVTKTVLIKWNSKIKNHYVSKGYTYTKMGDTFEVNVNDLTKGSNVEVEFKCDICGKLCKRKWFNYYTKRLVCPFDVCGEPSCYEIKSEKVLIKKYGVSNALQNSEVMDRMKHNNLIKYGYENPFSSKEIQNKIKQYYQDNYGVTYPTQLPETKEKYKSTMFKKYGVDNYSKTESFKTKFSGVGSPRWKGESVIHERTERGTPEYKHWRKEVFGRDHYTCQHCGARNGSGKYVRIEAHHIFDFKNNKELRYEVGNGVTLCAPCHMRFHTLYGKHGNDEKQFLEFQSIDKKIC